MSDRGVFWISYGCLWVLAIVWLTGCIQPTTMYGNVYQCPQELIEQVSKQLEDCANK